MEDKTVLEVLDELIEEKMPEASFEAKQAYKDSVMWFMLSL